MSSNSSTARALALRAFAAAAAITMLCGDGGWGCTTPYPDQHDATLAATVTQPAGSYRPGDVVRFQVSVSNTGTHPVDDITIATTLDTSLQPSSATCSGLGDPQPDRGQGPVCGFTSTLYRLPAGATAIVNLAAVVRDTGTGTATNRVDVFVSAGPYYPLVSTVTLAPPADGLSALFTH